MPLNFVAKAAINIGLAAANMALTASRKIEGPRLDNLKFTSGDYGSPLHMVWGLRRLEVPIFWAEDLREVKRRRKTKGGKFNEYSYFGTWAVAVAGHQISSVRRIWFDTHLIYDISGAGPITPFDFGGTGSIDDFIAIYLGTETQIPDPRMEATIEALHGEGSCPAYRGTAYICFKDIPLEKLGNRIPQVSVEVASGTVYPTSSIDFDSSPELIAFSPDYSTILASNYQGYYYVLDVAAQATMLSNNIILSTEDNSKGWGYLSDGTILIARPTSADVHAIPIGSDTGPLITGYGSLLGTFTNVVDEYGDDHWLSWIGDDYAYNGGAIDSGDAIGVDAWFEMIFKATDNSIWMLGRKADDDTVAVFHRIFGSSEGPSTITVAGLVSENDDQIGAFHYSDATHDHFVLGWENMVYTIDRETGSVTSSLAVAYAAGITVNAFRAIKPGASSFFIGFQEISSLDVTQIRQLEYNDWWGGVVVNLPTVYDPVNHALITVSGASLRWSYLDRVGTDGALLSTIMGDVAGWVAVEDYDFGALDQTIPGWSAVRGQASNMLEPLLDAYDSDIRPHDFTIQGVKRTGTSGGTLPTPVFVAENPRYNIKVRASAELPVAVMVNFADTTADQQPNAVRSARPLAATDARSEKALDLTTLALSPDTARALGDRHFRRVWGERREVSLSLTAQQLKLEPGDLRTLTLDDESMTGRLVKLTVKANDVLATEWKEDFVSLAATDGAAGAAFDGRNESVIAVPLISKGFFIDAPYVSDSDAQTPPIIYLLAAPYADGAWPGATGYQALDGEYSDEIGSVVSGSMAVWGYATELAYSNPNLWDRLNSITVTLQVGTLTGCTEADIDANPLRNLAMIGAGGRWEYVNFTTATLVSGKTYTVSGFKRGRRGTEWAAELHAAGDFFVLADMAQDIAMGLSEVGTNLSFKAITTGRTTAFIESLTPYTGASLMPYAPCELRGTRDLGSNDWALAWTRRTRVGGAWTSGATIPLSEASEEYEIEIMNGATVVRTVTGLSSATYTYSAANQTTDFGSAQTTITFRAYQVSDAVGRGYMASATV